METAGLTKFGCKCRNCHSYTNPDNGETLDCAKCGCPPIDHTIMRVSPGEEDDEYSDTVSGTPSWSLSDSALSVDFSAGLFDTKKRTLDDVSGGPAKKKPKGTTLAQKTDTVSPGIEGLLKLKPCKVLQKGHIPFTEMNRIPYTIRGVYKIAYNWQTIYVGSNSCKVRHTLKSQFSGGGRPELFEFIKSLSQRDLEKVTVYYLDETKYDHNCGKKSYMKCIEDIQGTKPKFNGPLPKKTASKWWCNMQ